MIALTVLAVFFVLLPAFGVGGVLGVPLLLCLAGALSLRPSLLRQAVENRPAALLLLLAFLGLAIVSSAWSEHSPAGIQAAKIAVLTASGLLFAAGAAASPRITRAGAVAAFAVLAILLAIEALVDLPFNRAAQPQLDLNELLRNVSRGASFCLALAFGSAAALMAHGGRAWSLLGLLALAAGGFVSLQFGQFANTVAFGAGLIAFFAAFAAPRIALWTTLGALLIWLAAAPFATPAALAALDAETLPYSWNARLEIWSYIGDRIREQPWIGHGLDAARAHEPEVPVHPHSASLQIWFETGALGVLLATALLIAGGRALVRAIGDNRPAAAAAAGTLATLGVIANVSYNLWAEWWFSTFFIAAGLIGALARSK
jgi:O-antigen ligase